MAKATRICKVCGKEYEYCKTWMSTNKFRYQDVACSPECGAIYFQRIEESRSPAGKTEQPTEEKPVKKASKIFKKEAAPVDGVTDHDDGVRLDKKKDNE